MQPPAAGDHRERARRPRPPALGSPDLGRPVPGWPTPGRPRIAGAGVPGEDWDQPFAAALASIGLAREPSGGRPNAATFREAGYP